MASLTSAPTDLGLDGDCICRDNFPLPTTQHLLADITTDIHYGRGFSILRGLDPSRYTAEDNMLLFLGISSYIGNRRGRQGQDGEMISKFGQPASRITLTKIEAHVTDSIHSTLLQQKRRLVHSHLEIVRAMNRRLSQLLTRFRTFTATSYAIYSLHKHSAAP